MRSRIIENGINVLNVAGSRASKDAEIGLPIATQKKTTLRPLWGTIGIRVKSSHMVMLHNVVDLKKY